MFELLQPTRTDALLALIGAFRADQRIDKIDVGVGVYRDEHGATPVMAAVKAAELRLQAEQQSKSYLGLHGDVEFNACMAELVLGPLRTSLGERLQVVQTAGGCGALRALADLVHAARPGASVWVGTPTWINHHALLRAAGLQVRQHPYVDTTSGQLQFDAMMQALEGAAAGDVLLLHGGCHNPTGCDLSAVQWSALTDLCLQRGLLPLVDLAYAGLGEGMDADTAGLRSMLSRVPEALVAVSCSKNFALYRDRVGAAMILGANAEQAGTALNHMLVALRGSYSMPPDHGAAVVRTILQDDGLRADWNAELARMRARLKSLRSELAAGLREATGDGRYDRIESESGLFSQLGLQPQQVDRLRQEFAVYMPQDSRVNVAGLGAAQVAPFVRAVSSVLR